MRSTSSGRRGLAGLLCVALLTGTGCPVGAAARSPSPALILTFHASDVAEEAARARIEAISRRLLAELQVVRVPVPSQAEPPGKRPLPPEADGAALERISGRLGEAARRMERMETREAERLLEESEREARSFRAGESLRPYLAEIFLRRGLLRLWAGNLPGAEEMFGRSRVLRPDFAPDPALFSPAFREAWTRAAARPSPGAEILLQSLPPGADILVDGNKVGITPARVRVPVLAPVVVRLERAGYVPAERGGQWLPGDSEMVDVTLARDRLSRLEELLEASGGGEEAGALLAGMASAAGAERVGVFVFSGSGPAARVRVLSIAAGEKEPRAVGEFGWPEGEGAAEAAGAEAASLLKSAGWPAISGDSHPRAAWYHKWWIWALLGAAVIGAAAGAGGGGGSSGGSTGAIGVNF